MQFLYSLPGIPGATMFSYGFKCCTVSLSTTSALTTTHCSPVSKHQTFVLPEHAFPLALGRYCLSVCGSLHCCQISPHLHTCLPFTDLKFRAGSSLELWVGLFWIAVSICWTLKLSGFLFLHFIGRAELPGRAQCDPLSLLGQSVHVILSVRPPWRSVPGTDRYA